MEENRNLKKLTQEERQSISLKMISEILNFLQLFVPVTLAKRIISIIMILAGANTKTITQLTGSCERSIRIWKNQIANGDTENLLKIGCGRGRASKFSDIEPQVLEELEKSNYQTLQQIADMVHEKFGVDVSIMAVSRLLKKQNPQVESRLIPCKGRRWRTAGILRFCSAPFDEKSLQEEQPPQGAFPRCIPFCAWL